MKQQHELSNTSMLFEDSNLFEIIDYEQKKLLATKGKGRRKKRKMNKTRAVIFWIYSRISL